MPRKRIGYFYSISMMILIITSFMMYNLFGGWGIFHWTAMISLLTLLSGMIPMLIKRPAQSYISLHFSFMYWSVVGLYGAFVAEVLVRIPKIVFEGGAPNKLFYYLIGAAGVITMGLGAYYFVKNQKKWDKIFISNSQ